MHKGNGNATVSREDTAPITAFHSVCVAQRLGAKDTMVAVLWCHGSDGTKSEFKVQSRCTRL